MLKNQNALGDLDGFSPSTWNHSTIVSWLGMPAAGGNGNVPMKESIDEMDCSAWQRLFGVQLHIAP